MNELDFDRLAEDAMTAIEEAVDDCGVDIDCDSAGGILTLEFGDGSQIIVNRQTSLLQLWIAARSGGFHFDYVAAEQCWRLKDGGDELFASLSRYCTEQAGEAVSLVAS